MFRRWDYCEYRRWRRRRRRRLASFSPSRFLLAAVAAAHATSAQSSHEAQFRRGAGLHGHSPSVGQGCHQGAHPPGRDPAAGDGLRWTDFHGIELPGSAAGRSSSHARRGLCLGIHRHPARSAAGGRQHRGPHRRPVGTGDLPADDPPPGDRPGRQAALLAADTSDYAALRAAAHVRPGQPAGRGYAVEAGLPVRRPTRPAAATLDIVTEGPGSSGDDRAGRHPDRGPSGCAATGAWSPRPVATGPTPPPTVSSLTGYTTFPNER